MPDASKMQWELAAEKICQAANEPISRTVRKASEELYETVMITVQDYMRENVEFNLASTLQSYVDTATRLRAENDELKHRADIAEQMAEALRKIARGSESVLLDAALTDAPEGFDECPINPEVLQQIVDDIRAALSAWEASNG